MLNKEESIKSLKRYFKENKIATMNELIPLLKTTNRMSVFRRLKDLDYISSFSAAGKYYSLRNIAQFGSTGLWIFNDIGFSRFGNLKDTLIQFIEKSEVGKTHDELKKDFKINLREALHHALLDLVKSHKISRITISNNGQVYLYISVNKERAKMQIASRSDMRVTWNEPGYPDWIIIEILASIIRINEGIRIEISKIVSDLIGRGIILAEDKIEYVLNKLNLKKTLVSK